jgi:hypothetical protein
VCGFDIVRQPLTGKNSAESLALTASHNVAMKGTGTPGALGREGTHDILRKSLSLSLSCLGMSSSSHSLRVEYRTQKNLLTSLIFQKLKLTLSKILQESGVLMLSCDSGLCHQCKHPHWNSIRCQCTPSQVAPKGAQHASATSSTKSSKLLILLVLHNIEN